MENKVNYYTVKWEDYKGNMHNTVIPATSVANAEKSILESFPVYVLWDTSITPKPASHE